VPCQTGPDLAVSIVSYRTPGPLLDCLAAVAAERDGLGLSVTVTDNGRDGSAEAVAERFPGYG